ncbi:hypothetical protein I0J43_003677 [Salmonella enterica]|nr:hypothetical protein [Salmonella enterica]
MNKLSDKSSNPVFTVIAIVIFFFFLPAIGAVLGTTGEIYIDGVVSGKPPKFCGLLF